MPFLIEAITEFGDDSRVFIVGRRYFRGKKHDRSDFLPLKSNPAIVDTKGETVILSCSGLGGIGMCTINTSSFGNHIGWERLNVGETKMVSKFGATLKITSLHKNARPSFADPLLYKPIVVA